MGTFAKSIKDFRKASPWLDATHAPAVASLEALAAELDHEVTAPLISQFGLAYRSLAKEAPSEETGDELEQALMDASK